MDSAERFTLGTLRLWGGLLVWAAYFLVLYVIVALACERGFADMRVMGIGLVPFATGVGLVVALSWTTVLVLAARRRDRNTSARGARFVDLIGWTLGLLAFVALVWTALPPLLLRTGCA